MPRLWLFLPLLVFAALAVLLFRGLSLDPTDIPSALVDQPMPAFESTLLGSGQRVTQEEFTGKPRLLNVWGTWCPTCIAEHPYLMDLAASGVIISGLNYKDEDELALSWLARLGDPYDMVIKDPEGDIGLNLGVYGAPETYVIDASGIIRYRHVGEVNSRVWNGALGQTYRALAAP